MSGAVFIFWVALALCLAYAAVFFAIGHFDRVNRPAVLFGFAFGSAGLSFAGEIALAAGVFPGPTRMVIALAMVAMFGFLTHGLALRYRVRLAAGVGFAVFAASALLYYLILDLPRADFTRQMLYQAPYVLVSLLAGATILRAEGKKAMDWLFIALFAALSLYFVTKPFVALWSGGVGSEPRQFAGTLYAALSVSSSAVLLIVLASCSLGLMIHDSAARLILQSQKDAETGLLGRAGFAAYAERQLGFPQEAQETGEQRDMALTLIAIDSPARPRAAPPPVVALAALLAASVPPGTLVGRMAEYDFAILSRRDNLFAARRRAEQLHKAIARLAGETAQPFTVCMGITEREADDVYADMLSRGLWALSEAQRSGGNCIRLAARSEFGPPGRSLSDGDKLTAPPA